MSHTLTGIVRLIGETVQVTDRFKNRTWVLTVDPTGAYPQHVSLQFTQDGCGKGDSLKVGQEVTAHINIRGREYKNALGETKYFNTIECWKVEAVTPAKPNDFVAPTTTSSGYDRGASKQNIDPTNDLPF